MPPAQPWCAAAAPVVSVPVAVPRSPVHGDGGGNDHSKHSGVGPPGAGAQVLDIDHAAAGGSRGLTVRLLPFAGPICFPTAVLPQLMHALVYALRG